METARAAAPVALPPYVRATNPLARAVCEFYHLGFTMCQVGAYHNMSEPTVGRILRAARMPIRARGNYTPRPWLSE